MKSKIFSSSISEYWAISRQCYKISLHVTSVITSVHKKSCVPALPERTHSSKKSLVKKPTFPTPHGERTSKQRHFRVQVWVQDKVNDVGLVQVSTGFGAVLLRFSCIFPKHLAQNCTSPARFRCENTAEKGVKRQEMWDNPTPYTLSYTQTYTRKCQSLLGFSMPGVGSLGDFQKTFFGGGEEECRNVF